MREVHMDFAFLGREDDPQRAVPVLVVKERTSKMVMSATVLRKTTGHICCEERDWVFARSRVPARDMVVKSDQESALCSIVEDVGRLKITDGSGRYVIEFSPGASQSNGMIEGAIQSVSGRVLLSALGGKMRSHGFV